MNSQANTPKLAITGGGSGGHLNTAIGVIEELKSKYPEVFAELIYIGGTRGMINDSLPSLESRKIPELGVKFIPIRSGKFHRRFSWYTLKLLFGVVGGLIDAWKVLRRERPDLVFSSGGYVTVPVVIAASLLGIPVFIHEQTIVSGLANRIAARFAQKVFITFPDSAKFFAKDKVVLTGNSLQKNRFNSELPVELGPEYKSALERFTAEKQARPFIFITGGSQGSHKINNWVLDNLAALAEKYNVLLQTGENQIYKDYDVIRAAMAEKLTPAQSNHIFLTKWFGAEIGFIYSNSDLVIARAGANTVLELLATNKRAIFIPIPWSSGNEQQLNAEYFCANQAGAIVGEKEIEQKLLTEIASILQLEVKNSSATVNLNGAEQIVSQLLT